MVGTNTQLKTATKTGKPVRLLLKGDDQAIKSQIDATAVIDSESIRISGKYKSLDLKHSFKDDYDLSGWTRFDLALYNDGRIKLTLTPPNMELVASAGTTVKNAPATLFGSQAPHEQITKLMYDALYQVSEGHGHDAEKTPISRVADLTYRYGTGEYSTYESEKSSKRVMDLTETTASTIADAMKNAVARKPDGLADLLRSHRRFGY